VLARVLETHGIVTTSISLVREHTQSVRPPRALFVPFPYGHALGRPDDPVLQQRVLQAALALTAESDVPVLRDFPDDDALDEPPAPTPASAITPSPLAARDLVDETETMVRGHAAWRAQRGRRTAFGLSGVPLDRFAEAVRTLDAFARGDDVDFVDRPRDVPLARFVRWCADDLKALFAESFMAEKPDARGDEILRRFWADTAAGQVLRRVRDRLDASTDPEWKAAAFGVAR
jgi:hypothetical protein